MGGWQNYHASPPPADTSSLTLSLDSSRVGHWLNLWAERAGDAFWPLLDVHAMMALAAGGRDQQVGRAIPSGGLAGMADEGDARIDGVPGSAAAITIDLLDIAGSSCGALLPTGAVRERLIAENNYGYAGPLPKDVTTRSPDTEPGVVKVAVNYRKDADSAAETVAELLSDLQRGG